jgi:type IV secretory pathway VirB10-like protein
LTDGEERGEIWYMTYGNYLMTSTPFSWQRAGAALLLAVCTAPALAQYSWIDDKGARVFSDRPPPRSTPASRILKAPRSVESLPPQVAPSPPPGPAEAPKAPKGPPTLAEREADFRKRAQQQAEADKKSQQEAQKQAAQAERCKGLKQREMTLATESRISEYDEKGQKSYLSDEERARRLAETRNSQAADCR